MRFQPDVVTCTYGAGGSTRDKTLDIVEHTKRRFGVRVASHLNVRRSTVEQLLGYPRRSPAGAASKTSSPCAAIRPRAKRL